MKINLQLFSLLKSKKNLLIFVFVLILIVYLLSLLIKTQRGVQPSSIAPSEITPTATITPVALPSPTLSVKWNSSSTPTPPDHFYSYALTTPLSSSATQNSLPQRLGFDDSQKKVINSTGIIIWTNNNLSLAINTKENSISFTDTAAPPASGQSFNQEDSFQAGRQIITNLFSADLTSNLIDQKVDYYKTYSVYSSPSTREKADLVRVSYYQSIDKYPVFAQSETGAVFTLYLDRNYRLHTASITGGFLSIKQGPEVSFLSFSEAKNNIKNAQRLNASPDLSTNFQVASSKNINLSVAQAKIGYLQIQNAYLPIYIFEGSLSGTKVTQQPGIFALPASK